MQALVSLLRSASSAAPAHPRRTSPFPKKFRKTRRSRRRPPRFIRLPFMPLRSASTGVQSPCTQSRSGARRRRFSKCCSPTRHHAGRCAEPTLRPIRRHPPRRSPDFGRSIFKTATTWPRRQLPPALGKPSPSSSPTRTLGSSPISRRIGRSSDFRPARLGMAASRRAHHQRTRRTACVSGSGTLAPRAPRRSRLSRSARPRRNPAFDPHRNGRRLLQRDDWTTPLPAADAAGGRTRRTRSREWDSVRPARRCGDARSGPRSAARRPVAANVSAPVQLPARAC